MAGFCIAPSLAAQLKNAAVNGEFTIQELYGMNSTQRNAVFAKYADPVTATQINAGFENAMASSQKNALANWVKNTFIGKETKTNRKTDMLNKLNELDQMGVLNPETSEAYLQDLVATRLGISVSQAEVAEITQLANKLQSIVDSPAGTNAELNLPGIEYFKSRKEIQNYVNSLIPSSNAKILISTVGRSFMLASIKSPVVNIASNTIMGSLTGIEKRIVNMRFKGLNSDTARQYVKYATEVYNATGYDITRMQDISDTFTVQQEGVVNTQGAGVFRKLGRISEDLVFKRLMGAPDVFFAAMQRASTADLVSANLAEKEGLTGEAAKARAKEIMVESLGLGEGSPAAEIIKAQSISDAMYATFTNDSKLSEVSLGIRSLLNEATGDARLGDVLMPFVKTPANVVETSVDYMGLGAVKALLNLPTAIAELKAGNKAPMQQVARNAVKTGLGLTLAFIIMQSFDPDDFIGAYPTTAKERELLELQNAPTNAVRIGNTWVSLDFFGPLAAPLTGMFYAKKYGSSPAETILKYGQGAVAQVAKLPGVETLSDVISDMQKQIPETGASAGEVVQGAWGTLVDQISSRLVPAFISDIAKMTDANERETDKNKPETKLFARIPGLRQSLPIRENIFGEAIKTESPVSTAIFGSRVKTANNSPVIEELVRLKNTGNLPSITDVEKTSTRVRTYKDQVSAEKYDQVMDKYQQNFESGIDRMINTQNYKRADNETKAKMITSLKDELLDTALQQGGYKKPR